MNKFDIEYVNGVMQNTIIKEDFCGACLALPLAFAGAGTATANAYQSKPVEENGEKSKFGGIFFWSVVISVLGLVATVWFMSDCKSCGPSIKRRHTSVRASCPNKNMCSLSSSNRRKNFA